MSLSLPRIHESTSTTLQHPPEHHGVHALHYGHPRCPDAAVVCPSSRGLNCPLECFSPQLLALSELRGKGRQALCVWRHRRDSSLAQHRRRLWTFSSVSIAAISAARRSARWRPNTGSTSRWNLSTTSSSVSGFSGDPFGPGTYCSTVRPSRRRIATRPGKARGYILLDLWIDLETYLMGKVHQTGISNLCRW